jgi:hypothetical protein
MRNKEKLEIAYIKYNLRKRQSTFCSFLKITGCVMRGHTRFRVRFSTAQD